MTSSEPPPAASILGVGAAPSCPAPGTRAIIVVFCDMGYTHTLGAGCCCRDANAGVYKLLIRGLLAPLQCSQDCLGPYRDIIESV